MVTTITVPMKFKTNTKDSTGKFRNITIEITDISLAAVQAKAEQLVIDLEAIGGGAWKWSLPFTYSVT